MDISQILSTIFAVLLHPSVIFVTLVVIFYLCFVNFVVRYRKRPPKTKRKKTVVVAAPASDAGGEDGGTIE